MDSVPYTERRNALTMNIDADTPQGRWEWLIDFALITLVEYW